MENLQGMSPCYTTAKEKAKQKTKTFVRKAKQSERKAAGQPSFLQNMV
jgi:hypothetical protein